MRSFTLVAALSAVLWSGLARADDAADASARGDHATAFALYLQRARLGDVESQVEVGKLYGLGLGVSRDLAEAARWYRKAAERGNARAEGLLSRAYEYGLGVNQDLAEALRWARKAAERGDAGAQVQVGTLYAERDPAEAARWYRKAAEQGDRDGEFLLGLLYLNDAAMKDEAEATRWLRKAADHGWGAAQDVLDTMERNRGVVTPASGRVEPASFGAYHALVIGNQHYRAMTQLTTPIADAREVARVLEHRYGFRVRLLTDASKPQIQDAIQDLRETLGASDNLLIYFAGHGQIDRDAERGYWLPVEADPARRSSWYPTADITSELRAMRARHVLVVADSCYAGTLLRAGGAERRPEGTRDEWVRRMALSRSRTVLTSGRAEPVRDGGGAGHSVFARAFLDALRENDRVVDLGTLFRERIGRKVVLDAEQTPAYEDIRFAGQELDGDFVLVPVPTR